MTDTLIHDATTNGGPPLDTPHPSVAIMAEIDGLYEEAKHFADGEAISSPEIADAISKLRDGLHDAGVRLDALRVEEKKPLDDAVAAVQARYNPYVQAKRGRVDLGKSALADLLTPWRAKVTAEAAAAAAAKRAEAEAIAAAAQEAIRSSSGNLEARERAEELLTESKIANKWAGRAEKAATTGTGLRTVWGATLDDQAAALEWAWGKDPDAFLAVAQSLADAAVRSGVRSVPGFVVSESKVAT